MWQRIRAGSGRPVEISGVQRRWALLLLLPLLVALASPLSMPVAAPSSDAPVATVIPTQPVLIAAAEPTATPEPAPASRANEPELVPSPVVVMAATPVPTPWPAPAATATPSPPVPRPGLPQRLRIPRLGIDAGMEYVGLTPDGAMDAPRRFDTVGWYELGVRPGELGNAVLAGHLDSKTGPAIFWELRALQPGDEVIVAGDDGVERRFEVTETVSYPFDNAPLERIFGPAEVAGLNLITCIGSFDRFNQNYDQRLVVYTRLVS